ncbi:DUF2236 domain-containing protein [Candidatus Roizmanbacteria bacterium]|nr:DUF2236 domain-containing protein [Candidatus Roizmanbacteria bacterium]
MSEKYIRNPAIGAIWSSIYSSDTHRLKREPFMAHLSVYAGLLMQFAHPLVSDAGVNYSYGLDKFFHRSFRTLIIINDLFGKSSEADRTSAASFINQIHHAHAKRGVKGAIDRETLEWVWATVAYCNLKTQLIFVGPLTEIETENYIQYSAHCGSLIGVQTDIDSWEKLDFYIQNKISKLNLNKNSLFLAEQLHKQHRGIFAIGPLADFGFQIAASIMPQRLVQKYNLPWLHPLDSNLMWATQHLWKRIIPIVTTGLVGTTSSPSFQKVKK